MNYTNEQIITALECFVQGEGHCLSCKHKLLCNQIENHVLNVIYKLRDENLALKSTLDITNKELKNIRHRKKKTYNLYYLKYNIIHNDYIQYVQIIVTDDIFHYVGEMLYKTFEEIKNIRWNEQKLPSEEYIKLFESSGYEKILNNTWWRKKQ